MKDAAESLPSDLAAAHAMILAERAARHGSRGGCGPRPGGIFQQGSADRPSQAGDREAAARALRDALGAQGAAAGSDGASARRSGGGSDRGRAGGRKSGGADADGPIVPAQAAFAQTVPRSSAARARGDRRAGKLSLLRVGEAVEAGRGHHRDAGGDPAAVEGDPDGAGEVLVPELRDDQRSRRRRSM